jgi:hypothetical protein
MAKTINTFRLDVFNRFRGRLRHKINDTLNNERSFGRSCFRIFSYGVFVGLLIYILYFFGITPFILNASAAEIYSQTESGTITPDNNTLGGTPFSGGEYTFGQVLGSGLSGQISTTTVFMNANGGLANPEYGVRIQCYPDDSYDNISEGCSSPNDTKTITRNQGKVSFDFSTPVTLDIDKYYILGIGCNSTCSGGTNPRMRTYGSDSDEYLNGDFIGGVALFDIVDMYFLLSGDSSEAVSITFPVNESSATDPNRWDLNWNVGNSTSTGFIFEINYGTSSTTPEFQQLILYPNNEDPGEPVSFGKERVLENGLYFAQAIMNEIDYSTCTKDPGQGCDDYTLVPVATSSQISFTVTSASEGFLNPFSSTSTLSNLNTTCDQTSGLFETSFCKLGMFLFLPKETAFRQFNGIQDLIKNKPPMGYLTQITGLFDDFSTTTQASSSFAFTSQIGEDFTILGQIRTGFGWFLWIYFGFWVLHRLRHFDFHL